MKFFYKTWITLLCCLSALLVLSLRELSLQADGKLHVYVLDVGQGDSILLVSPSGKQIVIDGGPNMDALQHLGKYMPFFDRTIELVVLTHPDSDHITALPELLRRYNIESIAITGVQHNAGRYQALLEAIEKQNIPVIFSDPSMDLDMGDGLVFDVVWPSLEVFATEPESANDLSIVLRALYKDTSLLLTGDIEAEAEYAILRSGADVRSTILKAAHHGSRTSSSTGFLLAVHPERILISAGRDNSFGHPHGDVLERYFQMKIPVQNTADLGTIPLVLDE